MKRPSVYDLLQQKGTRKFLEMHIDDELEAAAAEEAGIDIFTCEVGDMLSRIRAAAPGVFIQAGSVQGSICGPSDGIREGFKALEMGADAVYFAGSLPIVEAMAKEGIPVTGHIGLVPRWSTWTNYRAIGKTPEEAAAVYHKMKALESAGAWAVEVEVVPVKLADFLTRNTHMITEGMGCGDVCDTQYLFSSDVLGTNKGHYPRHSKKYADIPAALEAVQRLRVDAFRAFADDVAQLRYPERKHEVDIDDTSFAQFQELIGE
ncbi:3-methyl-2-oxobutanoate hydroxymethyltransferase [Mesorhizobium sp. M0622]|uniref:3-methyl-2-oxobutanoate hydroxymethyltransferase n=1 Tax=unclassified Mesorhizobium TaxID=325217 RepID=UPI00333698E3